MSKRLFLVLAVANFTLFLWEVRGNREMAAPAEADVPLEPLLLLTEKKALSQKQRATGEAAVDLEAVSERAVRDGPEADEGKRLEREDRSPVLARDGPGESPEPFATETKPSKGGDSCVLVGPFSGKREAEILLSRLREGGIDGELESMTLQVPSGYWLMIPPLRSREAAEEMLERLESKGIEDVWLFDSGPRKGAISLGLYSTRSKAEKVATRYRRQGLAVHVMPKNEPVERFWIRLQEALPQELMAAHTFSLQQRPCPVQSEREEAVSAGVPAAVTETLGRE